MIVAAKELGTSYVLMDDASARKTAESFSLMPIGTIGILKLSKIEGYITSIRNEKGPGAIFGHRSLVILFNPNSYLFTVFTLFTLFTLFSKF